MYDLCEAEAIVAVIRQDIRDAKRKMAMKRETLVGGPVRAGWVGMDGLGKCDGDDDDDD
jgi:hypothetical protein